MQTMTREQLEQFGAALTGEISALITDRMAAANVNDLNLVLSILTSLAAHYIAGIEPYERGNDAFQHFGRTLAEGIAEARASGMRALVNVPEVLKQ